MSEWKKGFLSDMVTDPITYGIVQPGDFRKDGVPLIRGKDYMQGWTGEGDLFRVDPGLHEKYKRSKVTKGDILLSIAGYVGETAVVPEWIEEANITQTSARIRCNEGILLGKYLFYFLQSNEGKEITKRFSKGSAQSGLNLADIGKFEIPVPPLPEQRKIAEILSGIDDLIKKKERQIESLENLEVSVLDFLANQEIKKGTDLVSLGEVVSPNRKITYGIVQAGPNIKGGIPYIRVTDMSEEKLDVNKMLRTSPEIAKKFSRSEVQEGDIVVALRGIIGVTHLIDEQTSGANLTQGTALLSRSEKFSPLYLNTILRSQFCKQQFSLLSKGSTIVEITLSSLATLRIPLPSISTQERIAKSVSSIRCQINASKKSLLSIKSMKSAVSIDLLSGRKRVGV
ncbi:restriction endonuclease subunit S [Synechococcus sp. RS9902]|uniref:restriction endonuclease subunit S n=1 Tax=Synechococcus sp. RS9902 TaxID=221345 RepID=UPI00164726DB|nr:restriction endonuclease subunit S [Synechococcus sp. RS9902]QNI96388.1 Putative Type I restriction-modification system S subunit [Synechococcus sp. RS9902]